VPYNPGALVPQLIRTSLVIAVAVAVTWADAIALPSTVAASLSPWFVVVAMIGAVVAWFVVRGPLSALIAEQRPLVGGVTALIAYALLTMLFQVPATLWLLIVAAAIGACCGRIVQGAADAGYEMFRVRLGTAPPGHVSDAWDDCISAHAARVGVVCGLLRAVWFFTGVVKG